jgi:DNA-binding NarL/FixJ family response regulator
MTTRVTPEPLPELLFVEDDDELVAILAPVVAAVGRATFAGSLRAAREHLVRSDPRAIFVDLNLPDGDGVTLVEEVSRERPGSSIIVITVASTEERILAAIRAGATGYLFKADIMSSIADVVRTVLAGGVPMSPAVARFLCRQVRDRVQDEPCIDDASRRLTPREREILQLFSDGVSYDQAAAALCISQNTVRAHVRSIYEKLAVGSKTAAVLAALRLGIVRGSSPPL